MNNSIKNIFILSVFLISSIANQAFAIEEMAVTKEMYMSDCIKTAIKNSPVIQKAKLNAELADSDLLNTRADYFPEFGAGVGYWHGFNTDKGYDDGYNKRFLPRTGIYINQLIYNFGKTSANIDMRKFYKIAAEYLLENAIFETVNDVKQKYFNTLETKAIIEIEQNNLLISENILDITKKMYEENKKAEIDYINAKVHLSTAKMNLLEAQNAYNQAKADLSNAIYNANGEDFDIVYIDTFDYFDAYFSPEFIEAPKGQWHILKHRERQTEVTGEIHKLPFTLEYAQKTAYEKNSELKALDSVLNAMKKASLAAKREYYPTLNGQVGYEYATKYVQNLDHTYTNNQLNVALSLNSSINPLKYKAQNTKADIQIKIAENDVKLFKQNIWFDIKKYYMDIETAQQQIENAKDKVFRALENLECAKKEYIEGKTGYLDLQSARQNYNTSKIEYIKELHKYNDSLSRFEKAAYINQEIYTEMAKELLK